MKEKSEEFGSSSAPAVSRNDRPQKYLIYATLAVCLFAGAFLRMPAILFQTVPRPVAFFHPDPAFTGVGFDEGLYRQYVNSVSKVGLSNYSAIVDQYIELQKTLTGSVLPPVRFLYIFAGYSWQTVFGTEALAALKNVASVFSILTLLLATCFAWRLKGAGFGLGVAALMAFAPTQVHMSQHALVDGFFGFWALLSLWLLWENLRAGAKWGLLAAYIASLTLLVLTKENSFFVWIAIVTLLVVNRWLGFGRVTKELVIATFVGPLIGAAILTCLAGGISTLLETYQLSVSKNYQLRYAILTGDGPWHRYLVDSLLVSPIVVLLAIGACFRLRRTQQPELFLFVFIAASYLIMCNLKYGINLRYANMWDMPLRVLALSQLAAWIGTASRYRTLLFGLSVGVICAYEMRQYVILFVQFPLYELVTEGLVRALHILKSPLAP